MPKEPINGREPDFSEDHIQREQFGPRGVPGKDDPAKMTPQREKKAAEARRSRPHGLAAVADSPAGP
jgi:hypothetical protein